MNPPPPSRLFTHPALFKALRHHDDVVDVLLPHHLPEVVLGPRQRSLSGDVLAPEVVALKNKRERDFKTSNFTPLGVTCQKPKQI